MKLKNLSRLTALLLAVMALFSTAMSESTVYDLSDTTGSDLETLYSAIKCPTCYKVLVKHGIIFWPDCATGYSGLYTHLEALTIEARYDLLTSMDEKLREAYIEAHNAHVEEGEDPLLCTCTTDGSLIAPDGDHAPGCPWYDGLVAGLNECTDENGNTYYILALTDADGNLVEVATAVRHEKDPTRFYLKDNKTGLYVAYLDWDENGNALIVPLKSEYDNAD